MKAFRIPEVALALEATRDYRLLFNAADYASRRRFALDHDTRSGLVAVRKEAMDYYSMPMRDYHEDLRAVCVLAGDDAALAVGAVGMYVFSIEHSKRPSDYLLDLAELGMKMIVMVETLPTLV